jgi:hypothetical protein
MMKWCVYGIFTPGIVSTLWEDILGRPSMSLIHQGVIRSPPVVWTASYSYGTQTLGLAFIPSMDIAAWFGAWYILLTEIKLHP